MKKIYIYKRFERFWHWTQSAFVFLLALTGFEVHDSIHLFGFEQAVKIHRVAALGFLGLIAFAIFWHITTGEWKQYIPTFKNISAQIRYYTSGIFKNAPHPSGKTALQKLNPLQVWVYLVFKLVMIPLLVVTGILYMFHKQIDQNDIVVISNFSLKTIAIWHTFGAFLLVAFIVVHVYMTTTGHTPTSNIKAMLTGYEEVDEENESKPKDITEKELKNV